MFRELLMADVWDEIDNIFFFYLLLSGSNKFYNRTWTSEIGFFCFFSCPLTFCSIPPVIENGGPGMHVKMEHRVRCWCWKWVWLNCFVSLYYFYINVFAAQCSRITFQADPALCRIFARLSSKRVCFPTVQEAILSLGGDYLIMELN